MEISRREVGRVERRGGKEGGRNGEGGGGGGEERRERERKRKRERERERERWPSQIQCEELGRGVRAHHNYSPETSTARNSIVTICDLDVERLNPNKWLNDAVVDFWMMW